MKNLFLYFFAVNALILSASPELTVPQGKSPVFDGKYQIQEYANALQINNFFLSSSASAPQERSSVSLLHDGKYLYVSAVLNSYALHPASNMGKEFRAVLKGKQQPVWDDDSFELRALSDKGERFYFGFNANEATYINIPARFRQDMPQVRCFRGKGFFSAEMKLPLELLNGKWRINFVRFEKRLKETSTMLPDRSYNLWSYQDFWQLSRGSLQTVPPALNDLAAASTQSLELSFPGAAAGEYQISGNGKSSTVKFNAAAGKAVKLEIPGAKKGENRFVVSIRTADGKWVFPEYKVASPDTQFAISWDQPGIQAAFNGETIKSGSVLPMVKKQNLLEISSDQPEVTLFFRHNGSRDAGFPGNFAGAEKTVVSNGKVVLSAPAGSKAPYKFRKTFTSTQKLVNPWGLEKNKLVLSAGNAYDFEINPVEWAIFPLEQIEFKVLLPAEIELIDAVSRIRYPDGFKPLLWPKEQNLYRIVKRENKSVNDRQYQLVTIARVEKLDKVPNMTKHYHSMRERCHLIFRSNAAGFKGEIEIFAGADKPAIAEIPRILPVEVVNKLDGVQPKELIISLYAQMQGNLDHKLEAALFETYKSAGINELFLETTRQVKDFNMMFFLELENYGYYRSVPSLQPLFDKYPFLQAKTRSGRPRGDISFTALADNEKLVEKDLHAIFSGLKTKYPSLKKLFWDFEHPPFTGLYSDYSELSLAKFKKDYKIGEEKLTPAIIEKKYAPQWIDFRTRELGRVVKIIRKAANANGYKLVMYSDYATDECAATYGLDWKYIRSSADEVYCGYGRNTEIIRRTQQLVAPSKTVFGLLTNRGSSTCYQSQILRRILDSRGGVLCWYEQGAGVLELKEIAEVTKVVSRCEKLIISGEDVKPEKLVCNAAGDMVVTRKLGNELCTFIINEENITGRVRIKFPCQVRDMRSGKVYPAGKTLSLKIPAMKFAAFSWKEN